MQEETRIPKTARDAFLIELIGDLGIISDMIKSLPEDINQATAGSLNLIAQSVEEAEKTASELHQGIEHQKEVVLKDFRTAVKSTLDEHIKGTLSGLENSVSLLQKRIDKIEFADPKSRKINLILSCALVITLCLSGAAVYGVYKGAQSTIEDLNSLISPHAVPPPK